MPNFNLFKYLVFLCFFCLSQSSASSLETYLQTCQTKVLSSWLSKLSTLPARGFFNHHTKAVIAFDLERSGKLKHIKIKHSTHETTTYPGILNYFTYQKALQDLDDCMLSTIQSANPFPPPPAELNCPRHMVIVFDQNRFHPLKLMIDDHIQYSSELSKLFN